MYSPIYCVLVSFFCLVALSSALHKNIGGRKEYSVTWELVGKDGIEIELEAKTLGYIGFGLSDQSPGVMDGADIVIAGVKNENPYLYHRLGDKHEVRPVKTDYKIITAKENGTHTTIKFSRLLKTGGDFDIISGDRDIIWSIGAFEGPGIDNENQQHVEHGSVKINFLSDSSSTDSTNASVAKSPGSLAIVSIALVTHLCLDMIRTMSTC